MPLRVSNTVEKNVVSQPVNPIVVAASVSQEVLPSIIGKAGEWAGRYIQNVGANDCYYAFGHQCDSTNYNGVMMAAAKQQLDCSNHGQAVSVFSAGGTTIAVTILVRNDNDSGTGTIF